MPMLVSQKGKRFLDMPSRAQTFASRSVEHTATAARQATETSRGVFSAQLSGRPFVPPRTKRPTTLGAFPSLLTWTAYDNAVIFDIGKLDSKAPYWIIQEIGTGQTAQMVLGNFEQTFSVRIQAGRELPRGFVWASTAITPENKLRVFNATHKRVGAFRRAVPAPFGHGFSEAQNGEPLLGQQNLFPTQRLKNPGRSVGGRIHKEIKGKHFLRDGGREGFASLRRALVTDYQDAFR